MDYDEFAETIEQKADADQELYVEDRHKRKVEWDGTTVKSVETERDSGASLRLFEDDRIGFSYANESELDANWLLDRSRGTHSLLPPDEDHELSDAKRVEDEVDRWYDGTVENSSAERVDAITDRIGQVLEREEAVRNLQVTMTENTIGTRLYRNGQPLARERRTRFSFSAWAVCDDGEDVQSGYEHQSSHEHASIEREAVLDEAARRGKQKLGATPPDSGTQPALLDSRAASGLLKLVKRMTDGEAVVKGRSAWDEKRLGEDVGNPDVTLIDDPARDEGASNRHFDAEGHAMKPVTLIDAGTYRSFLTNQYVARRTGLENNYRASRTYSSRPGVGATNLYLEAGETSFDRMEETLGSGPVITGIQPASGLDPVAGHFSVGCSGYFLRDGRVDRPFDEATMTGEIDDFLEAIETVGKRRPKGYSVASPPLLVSELSLGGN